MSVRDFYLRQILQEEPKVIYLCRNYCTKERKKDFVCLLVVLQLGTAAAVLLILHYFTENRIFQF